MFVKPTGSILSDLSVVKTVSPTAVNVTNGPQTVTYTIVIKNNGPQDAYIGPIAQLFDKVSTFGNSVPMQVSLVPGSIQLTSNSGACVPLPTGASPPATSCLDPNPAFTAPPGPNTVTTSPLDFAKWYFPATAPNSIGYIPANGTITLKYQLEIRRHPDLLCALGGETIRNEVFFGLTRINGVTITEIDNTNNTSHTDVAVNTGQNNDPDCALSSPGPIVISKTRLPPAGLVAWTDSLSTTPAVNYRITIKNNAPGPITLRLRDQVMEWAGTPPFDAQAVSWTCSPTAACVPSPPNPVQHLMSYFAPTPTVWDKTNITVPGSGGTVQVDITLKYAYTSCATLTAGTAGGQIIRNIARIDYTYNSTAYSTQAFVDTKMKVVPPCRLEVTKNVLDTDKVEFGVPLQYTVKYHNAETFPVTVGTLIDAVRIVQPNYATQLPFTYQYNCTVTSAPVTGASGAVPTTGNGPGNIVYTTNPSQGVRIIQNTGPVTFGANATLTCDVTLNISRPAAGDQYCMSSGDPRLENLALMDVSAFYNANMPWPPSGTYNASIPVTTPQPSQLTNWSAVSVKLPKRYNVFVNKTVSPGFTWAPGGPGLIYTITLTNAGGALTGSPGSNGWNGLLLNDNFFAPVSPAYGPDPGSVVVSSSCGATTAPWTGVPAGFVFSFLPITNFPAGCNIYVTFKVSGPFQPGQICNRTGVAMAPNPNPPSTDTADWYANNPNPATLSAQVCVPVLETNKLAIKKTIVNNAGANLPASMTFPATVSCALAGTPTTTSLVYLTSIGLQLPNNIPVGSSCTVNELWQMLSVPGQGICTLPAVPAWQVPTYSPGQTITIAPPPADNIISITNTVDCVTPPVNTLTVNKIIAPATVVPQLPSGAVFPVEVVCDPSPSATLSLTATALQQYLANIPAGTLCKISELPPVDMKIPEGCTWSVSYPNGQGIVIPAQGTPTLTVLNTLTCKPDLAISKTGPVRDPVTGLYNFTITVTSPGGPFTVPSGGLTVTDTMTGMGGMIGNFTASPSAVWNCSSTSPSGVCIYTGPGPTTIGQVLGTFTISYFAWTPAPYVNCATVSLTPSSGVIEPNLSNNSSCVHVGTGPRVDLKIAKTGPVKVPGSPGLSAFTLTVTNAGPPFYLPPNSIAVTDTATGLVGTFASISATPAASWNCSVSGNSGNCSYPGFGPVATGQVLGTIIITYHSPALANFTNCARVGLTSNAPLQELTLTNNQACVTVSDIKMKVVDVPLKCDTATTIRRGNTCACRFDSMVRTSDNDACSCPAGTNLVAGKGCVGPTACTPPMIASPTGTGCGCPQGTVQKGRDCVKPTTCQPPMVPGPIAGQCVCGPGTVQRGRDCVKPTTCQPPMVPGPIAGQCVCGPGTVQRGRDCVKPTTCRPPMVPGPIVGQCVCGPGTVQKGGECVRSGSPDPRNPRDSRDPTRGDNRDGAKDPRGNPESGGSPGRR